MKTRYVLETLQEYKNALQTSDAVVEGDTPMPRITGRLEVSKRQTSSIPIHDVILRNDPNYEFSITFKEYVIQASALAGLPVCVTDNIPT
jgi:hypothetical protein